MPEIPPQEKIATPTGETLYKSPFGATPVLVPKTTSMYDDPELATLRTFKSDMTTALHAEDMSLARIAIQEDALRRKELGVEKHTKHINWLTVAASLFFIAGGLSIAGYMVLYFYRPEPSVPIQIPVAESIIPSDLDITITNSGKPIEWYRDSVAEEIPRANLRAGFIKNIILTKAHENPALPPQLLNVGEAVNALVPSVPDRFARIVENEYMIGSHALDEQTGFFVLRTGSYAGALAELLAWEPKMEDALVPLLAPTRALRTGTTTPIWSDTVIDNIDARVLRDSERNVILIYSFMGTRDTLFLGANENTFKEVLRRKNAPRKAR